MITFPKVTITEEVMQAFNMAPGSHGKFVEQLIPNGSPQALQAFKEGSDSVLLSKNNKARMIRADEALLAGAPQSLQDKANALVNATGYAVLAGSHDAISRITG